MQSGHRLTSLPPILCTIQCHTSLTWVFFHLRKNKRSHTSLAPSCWPRPISCLDPLPRPQKWPWTSSVASWSSLSAPDGNRQEATPELGSDAQACWPSFPPSHVLPPDRQGQAGPRTVCLLSPCCRLTSLAYKAQMKPTSLLIHSLGPPDVVSLLWMFTAFYWPLSRHPQASLLVLESPASVSQTLADNRTPDRFRAGSVSGLLDDGQTVSVKRCQRMLPAPLPKSGWFGSYLWGLSFILVSF